MIQRCYGTGQALRLIRGDGMVHGGSSGGAGSAAGDPAAWQQMGYVTVTQTVPISPGKGCVCEGISCDMM